MFDGRQYRRSFPSFDGENACVFGKVEDGDLGGLFPHDGQLRRAIVDNAAHGDALFGWPDTECGREIGFALDDNYGAFFDLVDPLWSGS